MTLAAIKAISAIPERVTYEDKALVEAARAAYDKIATLEQQALVHNYSDLISAEQRIIALTPTEGEDEQDQQAEEALPMGWSIAVIALAVLAAVALGYASYKSLSKKKAPKQEETPAEEAQAEPVEEEKQEEPAQEEPSEAE